MSVADSEAFEKSVEQDVDALNEIAFHRKVNASLADSDVDDLRKKLGKLSRRFVFRKRILVRYGIAASVAALMLLSGMHYIVGYYSNPSHIYSKYYSRFEPPALERFSGGQSLHNATTRLYWQGDYLSVVRILHADSLVQTDFIRSMILVSSLMELERIDEAVEMLCLMESLESNRIYLSCIKWNKTLCYVRRGEIDKALLVCKELESSQSCYPSSLLRELKMQLKFASVFASGG
ncbi:MAG: hypothetical protein JW783_02705 [Bacteroidales bacterium]|nr:hypothetical protein [Bacteroidales bacterium]MBN2749796.1 hypothetical protein [Bacteroidales bacterium]